QSPTLWITVAIILATALFGFMSGRRKVALDPNEYQDFRLQEREEVSHDTRRFRFALPSPSHVLGLPIGQHISLKFTDADGKIVARSYTPTSSDDERGYVDFVIKVYFPDVHPKFPAGGKMSHHLEGLKIGDTIAMRGPKGSLTYKGKGLFNIARRGPRKVMKIGMIAGGTGITPMTQIVSAVTKERSVVEMSLVFANQSEADILLRGFIEGTAEAYPNFKFHYTVDRPPTDGEWKYSTGFITEEMLRAHLPPPGPDVIILMCGPPPMLKFACLPALEKIGYSKDMLFEF
ncbi:unnamed protein product, partial [Phaeothamnion confervicola]